MFYDMGATSTVATIVGKLSISWRYFVAKNFKNLRNQRKTLNSLVCVLVRYYMEVLAIAFT